MPQEFAERSTAPVPVPPSGQRSLPDWSSIEAGRSDKAGSSRTANGLTIVIPAYNESRDLPGVLERVKSLCGDKVREIIVVDDGSSDDTGAVAERAGVRTLRHRRNSGYGSALKTGIRAARTEYVLTMDAEGQHRAEDALKLWEHAAGYDMVVGARQGAFHSPLWRMPGKWLLRRMAVHLTRRRIPDLNSGLRLLRREVALKYLHICPQGFSFSTTITLALLSRGYAVCFVPVEALARRGKSTVSLSTGLDTIMLILRVVSLFNPMRVFVPMSLTGMAAGMLWGVPYAAAGHGVSVGSMLAIMTGVLLFGLGLLCDQISQMRLERYE